MLDTQRRPENPTDEKTCLNSKKYYNNDNSSLQEKNAKIKESVWNQRNVIETTEKKKRSKLWN